MNIKKIAIFGIVILMTGCSLLQWRKAEIYPMSYDQTYLTAVDALDDMSEWHLLETNKDSGIIKIEKSPFLRPTRELTVIVERIDAFRTKVELYGPYAFAHPFNQKFFKALDRRVAERALTYPS